MATNPPDSVANVAEGIVAPDAETGKQKGMDKAAIEKEILECEKLLATARAKLKSRPQVNAAFLPLVSQIFKTLETANGKFPRDLTDYIGASADAAVDALWNLSKELRTAKNPARTKLISLYSKLEDLLEIAEEPPYNPLNIPELTKSIEAAFSQSLPIRLSEVQPFRGSGVYALYYSGDFPLYKPISESNKRQPGSWAIYVGKAGKEEKRKGFADGDGVDKMAIYKRLAEQHAESIKETQNLKVEDFSVRYLPIEGLFVPLCEKMLITQHSPLWNDLVEGFGNKHMGVARIHKETGQQITPWDLLHPGRANHAVKPNKRFPEVAVLEERVRQAIEKAERQRPTLAEAISAVVAQTEAEADD